MQIASSLQTLVSHRVRQDLSRQPILLFWTDQTRGTFTSAWNEDDHEQDICMCFSAESEAEYGLLGVKQLSEEADFVVS